MPRGGELSAAVVERGRNPRREKVDMMMVFESEHNPKQESVVCNS